MIKNYLLGKYVYKIKKLLLLLYIKNVTAKFFCFLSSNILSKSQKYISTYN